MASIPKNNLRERLTKLGYDPNGVQISKPVLDNSRVKPESKPISSTMDFKTAISKAPDFKPPVIEDIDAWSESDFD